MEQIAGAHGVGRVRLDVARLPPRVERRALAGPEARQSDVELDERAPRIERAELLDSVERARPVGERGAELRLDRLAAEEDRLGLRAPTSAIEAFCVPQRARGSVVTK